MKTLAGWRLSGKPWDRYLVPGDQVDEAFYDYALELLSPAFNRGGIVAMGEPVGSWGGEFFYAAFRHNASTGGYQYLGNQTLADLERYLENLVLLYA